MYLRVHEDFPSHPKSLRLCARLQHPVAWAYMQKLWIWAAKYQKDGNLTGYEPAEIEAFVDWRLADGKFYEAAVRSGFLDEARDEEGSITSLRIHNWEKWTGGDLVKMDDEAERKRLFRMHREHRCDRNTCQFCAKQKPADNKSDASGARQSDATNSDTDAPADKPTQSRQGKASLSKASQDKAIRGGDPERPPAPLPEQPVRAEQASQAVPVPIATSPPVGIALVHAGDSLPPAIIANRPYPIGALTPAFLSVYDAYPNKDGKAAAAAAFVEISRSKPGGEEALSDEIMAAFRRGMLKRHPYAGEHRFRPSLTKFLLERRWEDAAPAPDNLPVRPAQELHKL